MLIKLSMISSEINLDGITEITPNVNALLGGRGGGDAIVKFSENQYFITLLKSPLEYYYSIIFPFIAKMAFLPLDCNIISPLKNIIIIILYSYALYVFNV